MPSEPRGEGNRRYGDPARISRNDSHDFWATYLKYSCSHAICNAHLLRELRGITENFGHQWSEALDDLLNEIKAAVDVEKGEERDPLAPERVAAFEERYRKILAAGEEETKTSEPPGEPGKRGKKNSQKRRISWIDAGNTRKRS